MELHYHRDEKTGIYNASVTFGHEHAIFSTQPGISKALWTSEQAVQPAYEAAQRTLGELSPNQPGFIHPRCIGGEWSLPRELSGKRSPQTILGVIATRPEDIHSLFTMHGDTQMKWHQYKLAESWQPAERHSTLSVEAAHLLGQSALRELFFATASEQLQAHGDELFSRIEAGDFWQPEPIALPQATQQPVPFHHAA